MLLHNEAAQLIDECIRIRRDLHKIPETGFQERMTQRYILDELKKYSPDRIETLANTGVKAVFYARSERDCPARTIAFRADMDGIETDEMNGVDYKSEHSGRMHACGHDGHMTMLLLTARLISDRREYLDKNVVLLFQPAEEGKGGASLMIEDGALKNPDVDRIYGIHLWPELEKGKVGVRWGVMMARTCEFDIIVRGLSAHGALPQLGVDAVMASAELISMLQTAISRNVDPHQDALLTIGKISGGSARNIIADRVELNATLRAFSADVYDKLMSRIRAMAEGLGTATGAHIEIKELMHYPCVNNPRHLVEDFYSYVGREDSVIVEPSMAAEDFSCYQIEVPGVFLFLGIGGGKNAYPLHHSSFDFDEDALLYGIEVYGRLAGLFS